MTLFAHERGHGPIHLHRQHPLPPFPSQVHDRAVAGTCAQAEGTPRLPALRLSPPDRVRDDSRPGKPTEGSPLQGGEVRTEVRPESPPPAAGAPSLRWDQGGRSASWAGGSG